MKHPVTGEQAGFGAVPDTIGIYIHWPFCLAKCPYCDFNSHVAPEVDPSAWARAFRAELAHARTRFGQRLVDTVFFGGGTPSLMEPALLEEIISEIRAHWPVSGDVEVTLEANPTSVEASQFRAYAAAGVNRVSVGVQSLRDEDLRRLGRQHSAEDAVKAVRTAQECFDRVSLDLIYARQDQVLRDWVEELGLALSLGTGHLSLYQLTIEEGTPFARRAHLGKLRGLPDDEAAAQMYEATQEICGRYGLPAYEVSNHARIGQECRHNLRYWRSSDWLGIGPGAHGRVTTHQGRLAVLSARDPRTWLHRVFDQGTSTEETLLASSDQGDEYLLMGLRTAAGVSQENYRSLCGRSLRPETVSELASLGLIATSGDQLSVTPAGVLVLNEITRQLLA